MKAVFSVAGLATVAIVLAVTAVGCAGDPETFPPVPFPPPVTIDPVPAPTPPLPAEPEPEPEPTPLGHAPLVGTRWNLFRLHGDMRTLTPIDGPVWIEFRSDGSIYVQGPENPIEGAYRYRPDTDSPRDAYNFEEGSLSGDEVVRDRRPGSYSEFEDVLLENLQLLKGYYIRGETPDESNLTIWGRYRSEEVVLIELTATGTIPE
jgi:hypothetical protein